MVIKREHKNLLSADVRTTFDKKILDKMFKDADRPVET